MHLTEKVSRRICPSPNLIVTVELAASLYDLPRPAEEKVDTGLPRYQAAATLVSRTCRGHDFP